MREFRSLLDLSDSVLCEQAAAICRSLHCSGSVAALRDRSDAEESGALGGDVTSVSIVVQWLARVRSLLEHENDPMHWWAGAVLATVTVRELGRSHILQIHSGWINALLNAAKKLPSNSLIAIKLTCLRAVLAVIERSDLWADVRRNVVTAHASRFLAELVQFVKELTSIGVKGSGQHAARGKCINVNTRTGAVELLGEALAALGSAARPLTQRILPLMITVALCASSVSLQHHAARVVSLITHHVAPKTELWAALVQKSVMTLHALLDEPLSYDYVTGIESHKIVFPFPPNAFSSLASARASSGSGGTSWIRTVHSSTLSVYLGCVEPECVNTLFGVREGHALNSAGRARILRRRFSGVCLLLRECLSPSSDALDDGQTSALVGFGEVPARALLSVIHKAIHCGVNPKSLGTFSGVRISPLGLASVLPDLQQDSLRILACFASVVGTRFARYAFVTSTWVLHALGRCGWDTSSPRSPPTSPHLRVSAYHAALVLLETTGAGVASVLCESLLLSHVLPDIVRPLLQRRFRALRLARDNLDADLSASDARPIVDSHRRGNGNDSNGDDNGDAIGSGDVIPLLHGKTDRRRRRSKRRRLQRQNQRQQQLDAPSSRHINSDIELDRVDRIGMLAAQVLRAALALCGDVLSPQMRIRVDQTLVPVLMSITTLAPGSVRLVAVPAGLRLALYESLSCSMLAPVSGSVDSPLFSFGVELLRAGASDCDSRIRIACVEALGSCDRILHARVPLQRVISASDTNSAANIISQAAASEAATVYNPLRIAAEFLHVPVMSVLCDGVCSAPKKRKRDTEETEMQRGDINISSDRAYVRSSHYSTTEQQEKEQPEPKSREEDNDETLPIMPRIRRQATNVEILGVSPVLDNVAATVVANEVEVANENESESESTTEHDGDDAVLAEDDPDDNEQVGELWDL